VRYVSQGGTSFPRGTEGVVLAVDRFGTIEWMPDDPKFRPKGEDYEGRGWSVGNHNALEVATREYAVSWTNPGGPS